MSRPRHSLRKLRLKSWLAAVLLAFLLVGGSTTTRAALVFFTAKNLADTTLGQDLWQFSYSVEDFNFAAGQGFTIFFERSLFTLLQSPPPAVNGGWDLLTVQPDLVLGSNGFYDALALQASPSTADPFKVNFVWLGSGAPAAQSFTIYDANFSTLLEGQTVEEPKGPIALRRTSSGLRINFDTAPGRIYRVEYTPDLKTPGWQPLTDDVPGDGFPMFAIDSTASQVPQRFYRIVETNPGPISIRSMAPDVQIAFETVTGRVYRVEYNDDLGADGWHVLIDNVSGDGLAAITVDAGAALHQRRCYRVVETQPAPP